MSKAFNSFVSCMSGNIDHSHIDGDNYKRTIFTISDISKKWVMCNNYEEYLFSLKCQPKEHNRLINTWDRTNNFTKVHEYANRCRGINTKYYNVEKLIKGRRLLIYSGRNYELASNISNCFNRESEKHGVLKVFNFVNDLFNDLRKKVPKHKFRKEAYKTLCSSQWPIND